MKDVVDRLRDEARGAWRFRWFGMLIAATLAILGWLIVFALPDKYEATASVFVDTRTALRPALQGLTVEQDVNVQLNYVRQSLLSGASLEKIARESGVLPEGIVDPRESSETLTEFGKRFSLDVRSAGSRENGGESGGSVYQFTYRDPDRERSLKVTEIALRTFVEDTLGGKRAGTASAQKFLETQIRDYEERLRTAENRLADFKKTNAGLLPTTQGDNFTELQREIDESRRIENDLSIALSRRAELERQLRGESVIGATGVAPGAGSAGASGGDTVARIKETQARLDELALRYTDRHPEVIATRANLTELIARREAEIESLRRGDASAIASSGVSTNPVYQSIRLQLNQADVEIASLRGQLSLHRSKAADLKRRLDIAPQVEAEFAQLNRDYEINKAQYTALLSNYEKAQLGERADDAGSVRFEVVQPPEAPFGPVSPKRTLLLAAVFILALSVGGALAYLRHLLGPVVSSLREIRDIADIPIFGVVSAAFPRELALQSKRQRLHFVAVAAAFTVALVLVLLLNRMGLRLAIPEAG